MQISSKGIDELRGSEGFRAKAYTDRKGVWTIGYGHTGKVDGVPVGAGMQITKAKAEELLRNRLVEFENAVNNNINVPLTQDQYDVLVSLAYNIGANGFKNSSVAKLLNEGNYQAAADELLEYNQVKDKHLGYRVFDQGVFNRRVREREHFFSGEKIPAPMPSNQFPLDHDLHTEPKPEPMGIEPADYSQKLAAAFGVIPSTQGKFPEHIDAMIKSIYDQTA